MSDDPGASGDGPGEGAAADSAPLSDLARRVGERREREHLGGDGERFEEEPYEALEAEDVWEAMDASEEPASGTDRRVVEEGAETHVVPKRHFCEGCRFLSGPPEVACTHEGTEIREFVDKERVRVYRCPVVEERDFGDDDPPR